MYANREEIANSAQLEHKIIYIIFVFFPEKKNHYMYYICIFFMHVHIISYEANSKEAYYTILASARAKLIFVRSYNIIDSSITNDGIRLYY